jgi:hypothetical protein
MRGLLLLMLLAGSAHADATLTPTDEVRAFVERWRDTQNRGDFAAYQALYAPEFSGVRRSGLRVATFDRAGWLADRQRMFKKKMTVTVDELSHAGAPEVIVKFTQGFASGNYTDRGVKELRLRRVEKDFTIVHEELLESLKPGTVAAAATSMAPATAQAAAPPPAKCELGTFHGQPAWLVLGEVSADAERLARKAARLRREGVEATPILSDWFDKLRPGLVALVHGAFATQAEAVAQAATVRSHGVRPYVKHSGALRSGTRLVAVCGRVSRDGDRTPLISLEGDDGAPMVVASDDEYLIWTDQRGEATVEMDAPPPAAEDHMYWNSVDSRTVKLPEAAGDSVRADDLEQRVEHSCGC